jgi:hypothetical protein
MIIRLAGALGVAALAFSFSLGNSSACPKATETPAAVSESVAADRVADVGVTASAISEPKVGEIAPLTAAEGFPADASTIDSAVAAPPVEIPRTAAIVAPSQKPDDNEDLALTTSLGTIVGKTEQSSDVSETSALAESDIAEWKLIFDAASAPAAAVMEGSPGAAPATIGAAEAIPAETVEANSPVSAEKPADPEIDITGTVPQHTAATEDLE